MALESGQAARGQKEPHPDLFCASFETSLSLFLTPRKRELPILQQSTGSKRYAVARPSSSSRHIRALELACLNLKLGQSPGCSPTIDQNF